MNVVELFLDSGHPNRPNKRLNSCRSYVFHYTANNAKGATARANRNYFNRAYTKNGTSSYYFETNLQPFRYGSAQIICDQSETVICIPLTDEGYAVGDNTTALAKKLFGGNQNLNTLSIEICNNGDWDKACNNAIEWVAQDIVNRNTGFNYNDQYAFLRHFDISGKNCPAPLIDNNLWNNFKQKLINRINELKQPVVVEPPKPIIVKEIDLMSDLFNNLVKEFGEQIVYDKIKSLFDIPQVEDWKVAGSTYLKENGWTSEIHDSNEIVDFGELGATIQKHDKTLKTKEAFDWEENAIQLAKNLGILKGDENGLMPEDVVTRGQLMTFFNRMGLLK